MSNNISADLMQRMEEGIAILKRGGAVAYPTDTVYGLGAAYNKTEAVQRIYKIKQRPLNIPLPLLLAGVSQLDGIAEYVSPFAERLMYGFWPGGLTLVLPVSKSVPEIITAGGRTVAVRIPAHPVPVALVKAIGVPIVGTSANLNGKPNTLTAQEVSEQLGNSVDFIIDGGRCPGGTESTIIDVSVPEPVLIREGAIPREEIEKVYGTRLKEGK